MEKLIKRLLLAILIFVACPAFAAQDTDSATDDASAVDWNPVMDAIIEVESSGNTHAKHGNSVGVMQITPVLVAECNNILHSRRSKKRYKLSDRYSVKKSKEMFLLFQSAYNPLNSIEQAIRSWNGGLHYSVKRTQRYFERVMRLLK